MTPSAEGAAVAFEPLPQFSPEFFATMVCTDTGRRKQFERGLSQLLEEGAIQVFQTPNTSVPTNCACCCGRTAVRRRSLSAPV
ncbi:MAG UNVERIFIED_CONTAM: hypothetical protein LVR18_48195 [Planctomycetaceae bacterium]